MNLKVLKHAHYFSYTLPLDKRHTVELGFTTRVFPQPVFKSDDLKDLKADLLPFRAARVVYPIQTHSCHVQLGTKTPSGTGLKQGEMDWVRCEDTDAVVTAEAGTALLMVSADCLPVFLVAPGKAPAVAIAHAGWRGTEMRIVRKSVEALQKASGIEPSGFQVLLGPALRSCCYEVGPEFVERFPQTTKAVADGKLHFDIIKENVRQLTETGIAARHIMDTEFCTSCQNQLFYSYRKERDAARRLISWILIR